MEVENFYVLAVRQHAFLCDACDRDGYYLDVPIENWRPRGQRRGWTRADGRRWVLLDESGLPSIHEAPRHSARLPPNYRYPSTRVETAVKIFNLDAPMIHSAQMAIAECETYIELAEVAPLIVRFSATHGAWKAWMVNNEHSDVDARWDAERMELWHLLSMHGLLSQDHKKSEWDKWFRLCTVKRQKVLNRFWLSQRPLSRNDIDPDDTGTRTRREIGAINRIAAMHSPPIPWEIRADPTTQKWEKHWLGG